MEYLNGDLLKGDWDVAAHICNNHVVMGSGVALALSNKWPEVYEADVEFNKNEDNYGIYKLGMYSVAVLSDGRKVYNLYAMHGIGNNGHPLNRNCQYDALYNALYKMCESLSYIIVPPPVIGIPYLMGCDRAGGSWNIVEAILKDMETIFSVQFKVYDLYNKS